MEHLPWGEPCDDSLFSDFAMTLDQLSDKYQVLFVVAAGNYTDLPRREWQKLSTLADRISSPGESVRALTVGSISHIDAAGALSAVGHPAPYSRCGPGPVFTRNQTSRMWAEGYTLRGTPAPLASKSCGPTISCAWVLVRVTRLPLHRAWQPTHGKLWLGVHR